ncbi:uncharacterized protein LOC116960791 isoform X2 [Tyto alba]|uniref:uncharacterized protein LOC116960791 isoform X2 n=1 Tax=Tyto alba TaxID=56313 RepID=UPI001C66A79D|nr:uncharacterized protein LOC116960791 isoform X2 [Tyto alba]
MKSNDPISQITVSGRRSECSEKSRGLLAVPGAGPVPAGRGGAAAPEPRVWYSPKGNRAPSGPPSCAQRAAAASAEIKKDGAAWPSRGCAASLARWRWGTDGGRGAGSDVAMKLLSRRRILVKKVAWSWLGAKDHALKARDTETQHRQSPLSSPDNSRHLHGDWLIPPVYISETEVTLNYWESREARNLLDILSRSLALEKPKSGHT